MTPVCADQHQIKDFLEISLRNLLFSSSSSSSSSPLRRETATNLHKFLPCNNGCEENDIGYNGSDSDPYGSDHFRMFEFKVRRCNRSRSHDWTDCPFAHPGEKARRRDPRRLKYSSTVCADFRRGGGCPRGDDCEFAHGVFECWLHPTRYRTEACKDGRNCQRKSCFFAHSPRELRILPPEENWPTPREKNGAGLKNNLIQCCLFCHPVSSSPTSTLFNPSRFSRSPSLSPPLSPMKNPNSLYGEYSPISCYPDRLNKFSSELGTGNVFNELISSIEAMNFNELSSPIPIGRNPAAAAMNLSIPWLDSCSNGDDQHQFLLSPVQSPLINHSEVSLSRGFNGDHEKGLAPDLGWVNELLM